MKDLDHIAVVDSLAALHIQTDSNGPREQPRGSDVVDDDRADAVPSLDSSATSAHQSDKHVQREGYGFRPLSGSSTPLTGKGRQLPLPDPNGLGWPAKSTLSRLQSTPAERTAREEKLANAVRTLLECIGEDPDREGLRRTPERYAQALMWMTRGYEERLAGSTILVYPLLNVHLDFQPVPSLSLLF